MNWEVFEEECTYYLNRTFGNSNIDFQLQGGHDCTVADSELHTTLEVGASWVEKTNVF